MTFRQLMQRPFMAVYNEEEEGGAPAVTPEEDEGEGRQTPPPPPGLTEAQEIEIANKVLKAQGLSALSEADIEALRQPVAVTTKAEDEDDLPEYPTGAEVKAWYERQRAKDAKLAPAPQAIEGAVMSRLNLADQAERQIRSEFPGLPEDDVQRIRNAFFDTKYTAEDLGKSFQNRTHMAYAALAFQEASKAGKLRTSASMPGGKSPTDGQDIDTQVAGEDKPTYEKFIQAFGRAYMKDGKIDHKLARQRFKEAAYAGQ